MLPHPRTDRRRPNRLTWVSLCALAAALLAAPAGGRLRAEDGAPAAPRKLALVVLIDNHNPDPVQGALAEGIGGVVTSAVTLSGKYDRLYLRLGDEATRKNLFADLHDACARDYVVDLVLESHGSTGLLVLRDGDLTGAEIVRELYLNGGEKLRLVYQMGCFSASLNDVWTKVGAQGVTGHVGVNVIPVIHLPVFLRAWVRGVDARTATMRAFAAGRRGGTSAIYRGLAQLFGQSVSRRQVEKDSLPVYSGRAVTIDQIPSRDAEAAWLRARVAEEGYW